MASAGHRVQHWIGVVLAICLDVWVVTMGKPIALASLVIYRLDVKAWHLEPASKTLYLVLQLWNSRVSVKCPAMQAG